ncbi:putative flavin-nucleotide-binding protein [Botrytis fragariae]|uniref:Putative flavin-nucleotide-binding protein n=1 Tax=Botrytis fragariae TaxID=1964551 RepID=A0A8H6EMP0_9HELO|nr:putative flavin-nucleotide-binding protein [Botrytis fragariae]KAF5877981.1 putative flavin-nucleotide-binding protein [Botrytis fragariae]
MSQKPCRLKGIEKGDPDIPVSVAASMVNSHYLGFSGFATGFSFANTVLNGTASLMSISKDNKAEREDIMKYIVISQIPDRWNHLRPIGSDVDYVSIIKITPNTQKSHTHSVPKVLGLEVQNDVEDKELCKQHWEGAISFWEKLGQPISGKNNLPEGKERVAPRYIYDFIKEQNAKSEYFARQMAGADYPFDYPRH